MTVPAHKPASFPFLAIAKKWELPYETVLNNAMLIKEHGLRSMLGITMLGSGVLEDIARALDEFDAIASGKIDWQTGEECKAP